MNMNGIFGINRNKNNIEDMTEIEQMYEIKESLRDCRNKLRFVFAGELYNREQLNEKLKQDHDFYDRNRSLTGEVLLHLIEEQYNGSKDNKLVNAVREATALLDGIYSFVVTDGKDIVFVRDPVGIKPLYYSVKTEARSVGFSSDKKSLWNQNFENVVRVPPGNLITVNLDTLDVAISDEFATGPDKIPVKISDFEEGVKQYQRTLENSVRKMILEPDDRLGILISGGVDSTMISKLFFDIAVKEKKKQLIGYTVGFENSSDLTVAKRFAEHFGIEHHTKTLTAGNVEEYLPRVIRAVEDRDFVQVETSIIPYAAMELAAEDNIKIMIVGQGPDEMWGGYVWYPNYLKEKGFTGLHEQLWEDFLLGDKETFERENKVARTFGIELRYPYLDSDVINVAMSISPELKISSPEDRMGKLVHREAAIRFGVPPEYANKPKEAAQIGSGVHQVLDQLAKDRGFNEELVKKLKYSAEAITDDKLGSSARYGFRYAEKPEEWQVPAHVCLFFDYLAYNSGLLDKKLREKISGFLKK